MFITLFSNLQAQKEPAFTELIKNATNDSTVDLSYIFNSKNIINCSNYNFSLDKPILNAKESMEFGIYKVNGITKYIIVSAENYSYIIKKHLNKDSNNLFSVYRYKKSNTNLQFSNLQRVGFIITNNKKTIFIAEDLDNVHKSNKYDLERIKKLYVLNSLCFPKYKFDLNNGEFKIGTNYFLYEENNIPYIDFTGISYFVEKFNLQELNINNLFSSLIDKIEDPDSKKIMIGFTESKEKKFLHKTFPIVDLLKDR